MKDKGHVRKHGKGWQLKYDVGRNLETDERITHYQTVYVPDKAAAKFELRKILQSLHEETYVEPQKMTVAMYLNKWLDDSAQHRVSPKTLERYTEIVDKHLTPLLGHHRLTKLRPLHIQGAWTRALESGRCDGTGGLSPQTVLHFHRILYRALKQAVRWQMLSHNPAENVDPPSPPYREMQVLNEDELATLLKAVTGTRLYMPILLAVSTGLRRGELLALRWSDVDLTSGMMTVTRSLEQTRENGLQFKLPKTKRSSRPLPLSRSVIDALKEHKVEQAQQRLFLGLGKDAEDLIFTTIDGRTINPRNFSKEFTRMMVRVDLGHVTFHGLRHTHITMLLKQGVHPKIASERAGHASVAITMDRYSHVLPGMQENVAEQFDATLCKVLGK